MTKDKKDVKYVLEDKATVLRRLRRSLRIKSQLKTKDKKDVKYVISLRKLRLTLC